MVHRQARAAPYVPAPAAKRACFRTLERHWIPARGARLPAQIDVDQIPPRVRR